MWSLKQYKFCCCGCEIFLVFVETSVKSSLQTILTITVLKKMMEKRKKDVKLQSDYSLCNLENVFTHLLTKYNVYYEC